MIKIKGLILIIISFLMVNIILFITLCFNIQAIGVALLVIWIGFFLSAALTFIKININIDGSLTFETILRKKTFPFQVFAKADVKIMRTVVIKFYDKMLSVALTSRTKDGILKIILLSEEISKNEKDFLFGKINRILVGIFN